MKLYPKERELVSEGDHLIKLTKIADGGEQKNDWDETKHYIRSYLVVLDEKDSEDNFKTISDRWNISFNSGARLHKAILAFTGRKPDQGFETDDLLGLRAIATVKWNATDKGTFDNITDYKPIADSNNGDGTPTPAADNAVPPAKTEDTSMSGAIAKAKKKARIGEAAETELKITDADIPF
jgi:hypothetical protein